MTTDTCGGMVTAAHPEAAAAGVAVLAQGGNAVDAAVATGFALAVVDPANTGVGGYGGFMVVDDPASSPQVLDFNTAVPEGFDAAAAARAAGLASDGAAPTAGLVTGGAARTGALATRGAAPTAGPVTGGAARTGALVTGGAAVSVPRVVAGLTTAHRAFGRVPLSEVLRPAIRLAGEGVPVGADLARSLAHAAREGRLMPPFTRGGRPLREGERLVQTALAATLGEVASRGGAAFTTGPLVEAMCAAAGAAGGSLAPGDFARAPVAVVPAERMVFDGHHVAGPPRPSSGTGVLFDALAALERRRTGEAGSREYVTALADALRAGWRRRLADASVLFAPPANTTHSCAADADGTLVSVTHTHGLAWFGSGIVAGDTGIVLNAGVNSFARSRTTGEVFPMTNMAPVVVSGPRGRFVLGTPGGARIPAIVLQALVDVVRYGFSLDEALRRPRVAVGLDGGLEVERPLTAVVAGARVLATSEFFGPANGIAAHDGLMAALDPRFACAVSRAPAAHRRAAPT